MNLRTIQKAFVLFLMLVSVLMPAKMGMGQKYEYLKTIGQTGSGVGDLDWPTHVTVLGSNIYVAEHNNHRVSVFSVDGTSQFTFGGYGSAPGQFVYPIGIASTSDGNIVTATAGSNRVQKFSPTGTELWQTGGTGTSFGQFRVGRGLSVNSAGDSYVADCENHRIQVIDASGNFRFSFGTVGSGDGQFLYPFATYVTSGGEVYVVDKGNNRIQVFDLNGNYIRKWGQAGGGPGQFLGIEGVLVDQWGTVFVADPVKATVHVFDNNGNYKSQILSQGTDIGSGLVWPMGMALDSDQNLYVVEHRANQIRKYKRIDDTTPVSQLLSDSTSIWSNVNVAVTITAQDLGFSSGVKEIHYSINMGAEQIVTGSSASFTLTETGTHSISYFAVDNAGNIETTQYATVKIDKIAPVTTLTRNAGLITLSATDAHSGVTKIKYQINGGAVADYSVPFADTIHKVTYWAEDAAGNIEAAKTDIINAGVQSVYVSLPHVTGGIGVIGTVTLDKAAGVGGTVINLASSLPGVAVVDATVTVPEGATAASFDIDANPVSVATSVSITASIYETSQSALITVQAPMPSSVTWSVSPVVGGTSTVGTLTLTSPAPTGGTSVSLASSSLSALVGSSVNIPAGAMTASFTVSTNVVSNDTSAVISATVYGAKLKSTLGILGPKVTSVTLAASSIASTTTTTGTVTLSTNAPVGGKVVNLSSSNSAVASVPVSVTVPTGTNTATFTITAGTVNANTNATISATTNGSSGTATITVTPPPAVLSNLTTNVSAITGGLAVTGTVTLTSAAPTGGAVIALASTPTTAGTVPASVTVAAGATSATFTITTRTVTASSSLTITATRSGVSRTATITVNPVRVVSTLTLNPTSVRGGTNSTGTVTLSGIATEAVVVTLTSATTTVARVPTSVTVPAGSTTATFTITTLAQTATRTSIITAATGTTSRTATLSVTR